MPYCQPFIKFCFSFHIWHEKVEKLMPFLLFLNTNSCTQSPLDHVKKKNKKKNISNHIMSNERN